jgi:hypothetical protein
MTGQIAWRFNFFESRWTNTQSPRERLVSPVASTMQRGQEILTALRNSTKTTCALVVKVILAAFKWNQWPGLVRNDRPI